MRRSSRARWGQHRQGRLWRARLNRRGSDSVRTLAGIISNMRRRIGGREASTFEEAVREAFRAAMVLGPALPLPSPVDPESPAARQDGLRPISTVLVPMLGGNLQKQEAPDRPEVTPSAARPPRQAGDTAPDHLLRPSASVPAVADDFFDGLVRRVEGDR
jgi:hypothetical protein